MLTLLLYVLILGVVAYVIQVLPIAQPFKVVAYAILVIMLLIILFNFLGTGINRNMNFRGL